MAWPQTVRKTDFNITWFSGTGAGGQYRNKHQNCCRMVHIPTGFMTTGQSHRDRPSNQSEAFDSMAKKLVPLMKAAVADESGIKELSERCKAERIRTYNYSDHRVKDHRLEGKSFDLHKVLDGEIDSIISELQIVLKTKEN